MIKKGLLFLLFCILCEEALATVFSVIPTDKSKQYLGAVFGGSVGGISLGGNNNITLSLMFEKFNFIIVSIGAVILAYLGISSTINTAREGEAMGKKISLWVPLRALGGMLLMVPGPTSGYSVAQMTVMWIVLNGIGAANSVWNVVLGQLAQNVSAVGGLNITITPTHLNNTTQSVLNASACMYSINSYMPELSNVVNSPFYNYGPVKVYTTLKEPVPAPNSTNNNRPGQISQNAIVSIGLQGAQAPYDTLCGYFTVTTSVNSGDSLNNFNYATVAQRLAIKVAALQAMFSAVDAAAQILANPATSPQQYTPPDPGYVRAAGQAYIGQIAQLAIGIKAAPSSSAQSWEADSAPTNPLSGSYQTLQSYGWIHAGSYYYTMVKATTAALDPETTPGSAKFPTSTLVPSQTALSGSNNRPGGNGWPASNQSTNTALVSLLTGPNQTVILNTALQHAMNYWTVDQQTPPPSNQGISVSSPSSGVEYADAILGSLTDAITEPILEYVQDIASGDESVVGGATKDPLLSLGRFGTDLMLAGELATFAALAASIILSLALSAGSCISPLAWGINLILVQIVPIIYGATIMLWSAGATLGVYIPMVPYLIFTTSAFGWIIAVIEAVVGAPLIALGLVHPSGDEELGKITHALPILANIFLRPTLMIFGFVLGASLLRAGIALINFGFVPAIRDNTAPSLFSIIAVLGMYVFLVLSIINKAFSLIYMLPNQIMRWIGGPTETFDPSDMVKEAKGGAEQGAAQVSKGMQAAHKKVTENMESNAKQPPQLPGGAGGAASGGGVPPM